MGVREKNEVTRNSASAMMKNTRADAARGDAKSNFSPADGNVDSLIRIV